MTGIVAKLKSTISSKDKNLQTSMGDALLSLSEICLKRKCIFQKAGAHRKHTTYTENVYYFTIIELNTLSLNTATLSATDRAYTGFAHSCRFCEANLLVTDIDQSLCNICAKAYLGHPFNPNNSRFLDSDAAFYQRDAGFDINDGEFYNYDCNCEICWRFRDSMAIDNNDLLVEDSEGYLMRDPQPGYTHVNPELEPVLCAECDQAKGYYLHEL